MTEGKQIIRQVNGEIEYFYSIKNGTVKITKANISTGVSEVMIPSWIEELPVTSIGEEAFSDSMGLKKITIPESVNRIEARAFAWCSSLKSVTILGNVTSIGWGLLKDASILQKL